jgi:hypothetical protein
MMFGPKLSFCLSGHNGGHFVWSWYTILPVPFVWIGTFLSLGRFRINGAGSFVCQAYYSRFFENDSPNSQSVSRGRSQNARQFVKNTCRCGQMSVFVLGTGWLRLKKKFKLPCFVSHNKLLGEFSLCKIGSRGGTNWAVVYFLFFLGV